MSTEELDDLDRAILYRLQRDARHETATDIAKRVGVTANTVRNRIDRLEERGVVTGYAPRIDYERAGYQLRVLIRCTAPVPERAALAREVAAIDDVVSVTELMTGRRNLELVVVANETDRVTEVARRIAEIGLEIEEEELLKTEHASPFEEFGSEGAD